MYLFDVVDIMVEAMIVGGGGGRCLKVIKMI